MRLDNVPCASRLNRLSLTSFQVMQGLCGPFPSLTDDNTPLIA